MSPEEAVKALDEIQPGDPEESHGRADGILLASVPPEVAEAYHRAVEREGRWWYA